MKLEIIFMEWVEQVTNLNKRFFFFFGFLDGLIVEYCSFVGVWAI